MKKHGLYGLLLAMILLPAMVSCQVPEPVRAVAVNLNIVPEGSPEELVVAVAVPKDYAERYTGFLHGVELAQEDIALMDLPIPLRVQVDDDEGDFSQAIALAADYIADSNVLAVVGHWYSDICSAATSLYRSGEKVLIVPTVSISSLLATESDYIFRNIPDDAKMAEKMCELARTQGAKSVAIYYEDSAYGFDMSAHLQNLIGKTGMSAIDRVCSPNESDMQDYYKKWKALGVDTVMMVCNAEEGIGLIRNLENMGFEGSFICSDGMDSESVFHNLKSAKSQIIICSIFDSEQSSANLKAFGKRYEEAFGNAPDVWAIQGYDSVMIVANAVQEKGIQSSRELSAYFRTSRDLQSLYGATFFDESNEINGKPIYYKTLD